VKKNICLPRKKLWSRLPGAFIKKGWIRILMLSVRIRIIMLSMRIRILMLSMRIRNMMPVRYMYRCHIVYLMNCYKNFGYERYRYSGSEIPYCGNPLLFIGTYRYPVPVHFKLFLTSATFVVASVPIMLLSEPAGILLPFYIIYNRKMLK
jgi:hypothetical protein